MTNREFFEHLRDHGAGDYSYDGETISEFMLGEVKVCLFVTVSPDEVNVCDIISIDPDTYFTSFDFYITVRPDMTFEDFIAEAVVKLIGFIDSEQDFIVNGRPFASYLNLN